MKLILMFLILTCIGCSMLSCDPVKDENIDPAGAEHKRVLINIDNEVEAGIHGTIEPDKIIYLRTYKDGLIHIRGLETCGYYNGRGVTSYGWNGFDIVDLPEIDLCLYSVQSDTNAFDAPAIGYILIRFFNDPNVVPLTIKMNRVVRDGINWVQLKAGDLSTSKHSGIYEERGISVYPSGRSGKMIITGCGMPNAMIYEYDNIEEWSTTVDNLYKHLGKINKDCVFTITANNDAFLKESASFLVAVYKKGVFLDAPHVYKDSKKMCFSFMDKYVVAMRVNSEKTSSWNTRELCVVGSPSGRYEVEGTTSKQRTFYGIYNGGKWEIVK